MSEMDLELAAAFIEEATQLLEESEQCFLNLESMPDDPGIIEKIFRLAHNLKGSSKAVGFDSVGAFAHEFESLLLKVKNKELAVSPPIVTLLLKCNDHITQMFDALKTDYGAQFQSEELISEIHQAMSGIIQVVDTESEAKLDAFDAENAAFATTPDPSQFENASQDLTPETNVAPEPATAEQMAEETGKHLQQTNSPPSGQKRGPNPEESIRVNLSRLETLLNFVGEMVILQSVLTEQAQSSASALLKKTVHQLGKVTKEVQDISMGLRMVPIKPTFQKMQRIVRDTAQVLNKKVTLELHGDDTEVDKTVLEHLGDPLVHMVRNSVDHGIETPEKRLAAGKPEMGTVHLKAGHQGGKLILEISDDGAGIDPDVLTQKAIEKGILAKGTKLSREAALHLIFHPGFSTKAVVTEVSGRGVGMDVVKTNIEGLQGQIELESELGKGTRLRIILPLTLAIIDGMVVSAENQRFVLPLSHVHESVIPTKKDIHESAGLGEVLLLRGETLPLFRMSTLVSKKPKPKPPWEMTAIVIRTTAKPFAILVDDIIGQQQIVIKKLGQELSQLKEFIGSAILGDGKPALIVELSECVNRIGVSAQPSRKNVSQKPPQRSAA